MSAPIVPLVHLNGTSKDALMEGYLHALDALRAAYDAVCATAPNGRDYYPKGDGATLLAVKEHARRLVDIAAIIREIEQIAEAVDEQEGGRS
jgi:hypothetical protein